MPLYEYRCHACGKTFEVIQKFSDDPLTTHPVCGGEVEKLVSAPAFHLKGTGWYATDYAKKGASGSDHGDHKADSKPKDGTDAAPSAESSSSSASDSDSSSSTESKSSPAVSETKPAVSPAPATTSGK